MSRPAHPLTMIGRPACTCDCKCATLANWNNPRRFCGCCPDNCGNCEHDA